MNSSNLKWLFIGVVVMLIGFEIMVHYSGDPNAGAPKLPVAQTLPDGQKIAPNVPVPSGTASPEAVKGQETTFSSSDKSGQKQWDMHATSIIYKDEKKQAEAEDITATFYSKDQKPVATVKAKGATMNTATQDVQFHGVVHAWSPVGETLTVQTLRYDGGKKRFYGADGVKMTKGTSTLTGEKLVADPSMKWVQVSGKVQVELHSLAPIAAAGTPTPAPTPPPSKT